MEPRPYYTSPVFTPARHRTRQMFHMAQPMDSSTPVLDLSIRKHQPPTPSPEAIFYSHNNSFNNKIFGNPQQHQLESPSSSTFFGDSESDASRSSDGGSPFNHYSLKMKATRPFKAYPKDPLQFFVGGAKPEGILGRNSMEAYAEFRNNMLSTIQESHKTTNKNMRRVSSSSRAQNAINDPTYWEKRRKNNEAAKRSRDLRRKKEDEIAIRCVFLENENVQLKTQVLTLKDDVERLSKMLGPIRN